MVTGKSSEETKYFPEKITNSHRDEVTGQSKNQNHTANFFDCIRTRKQPNAPVEIGYKSVAVIMANIAYREKRRVTLAEAMAYKPEYA